MIIITVNWIKSKRILGYHTKNSFLCFRKRYLDTKVSFDDFFDDLSNIGIEGRRLRVV